MTKWVRGYSRSKLGLGKNWLRQGSCRLQLDTPWMLDWANFP